MTTDRRPAAQAFLAGALLAVGWLAAQAGGFRFDPCYGCMHAVSLTRLVPVERTLFREPCPDCITPALRFDPCPGC